jgi:flagellar hook-basal body complex protein FliE
MTNPIAAIAAVSPIASTMNVGSVSSAAAASPAASGPDFASALARGFDAVNGAQSTADNLAVQAATGTLTDPSRLTVAATQAQLMTQLATTIESKAVAAFNQIMGMQA